MKIVHCLFTMKMGGAQVLAIGLLNEMCKGNKVSLVIVNNQFDSDLLKLLDKRVDIYYINRKPATRNIVPVVKLNLLLLRLNPDIIHCHEPNMVNLIRANGCKLVQTVHDVGIPVQSYNLYHLSIAISSAVYNDIGLQSHRCVKQINNGVFMKPFKQRIEYSACNSGEYRIVQVGRLLHGKKGQDILIKAMKKLVCDYGFVNARTDIVGAGPSYDYLTNLIVENQMSNHITLLGERDRHWLNNNLCNYHLLVQPSRYEGFGLTVIEGFAAGIPVLASNIDGPYEILSCVPAGFTFLVESPSECAKMLNEVLSLYQQNKMSSLMQETIPVIKSKYSIESCARSYLEEYLNLLIPNEVTA